MKNEEYVNIDLFKLIMAICVVAMHINPFAACSNEYIVNLYDVTVRMAVPFFFMSTGFLIAKKGNDYRTAFKRILKKTARLYCIWTLVYLPITLSYFYYMQYGLMKAVKEFFIGFFFVGEQYNSWMLWYLLSLFITSCMMYVLETHISHESITVLGFVLMLFGFAIDYFMHEVNIATYTGIGGGYS